MRKTLLVVMSSLILCGLIAFPLYAERLLPPAPPATKDLVVVDWSVKDIKRDRTDDLAVRSLQGLVNRKSACVWVGLDPSPGRSGWWLKKYQEMGCIVKQPRQLTKDRFLQDYKSYAKGVVVPPANLGLAGYRIAVMKAASDDLIIGSRQMADKLGLKVVEDYTERFKTYAESWRYALDELWPLMSHSALFVDREDLLLSTASMDYVIQQKLFVCAPHKDVPEETKLFRETLSRLRHNTPVMGSAGGTGLLSEGDIIREVSKRGCVFVGCAAVANMTVHAGMKSVDTLKQPMREALKLDRSKAYIAIEISDGDNSNTYFSHIHKKQLWENRGRVPLGWTICQGTFELAPAVAKQFYDTRTPLDEFITGVSGYSYMFPGDFGNGLAPSDEEDAWDLYLKRTDDFLASADIHGIATLQYQESPGVIGREVFSRYANGLKNASCIINGYNGVYKEYGGKTYEVIDGLPVFYTVTERTWSKPGDKTLADEVIERTPKERPAFLTLFMLPFALSPEHFDQVVDSLKKLENEGYVLVLPSELAALVKEAELKK